MKKNRGIFGLFIKEHPQTEGSYCIESGKHSHAVGMYTVANGDYSHAEGYGCIASAKYSHAEGYDTWAEGIASHAEGRNTCAYDYCSHASGYNTIASAAYQMAIGMYNKDMPSDRYKKNSSAMFVVGKGESHKRRSNCFRVGDNAVWGGTYQSSGADYAEMFEWEDGNPNDEDRVGKFVSLDKDKIVFASDIDDVIGITSGNPSICGDTYDDQWQGMFETDVFGRPIYEDVTVADVMCDDNETVLIPEHVERWQKLNPEYDNRVMYKPRSQRKEWAAVGIVGKLVMLQDGTITHPGQFVKPGDSGVGTLSESKTSCRVMKVIDEYHIQVFIK